MNLQPVVDLVSFDELGALHFIAIGGAGMGGIAGCTTCWAIR